MDVKTYRARSMSEALALVRADLGPDAAVLHTREVRGGLLRWLGAGRRVEITAACDVRVASRMPSRAPGRGAPPDQAAALVARVAPASPLGAYRATAREEASAGFSQLNSMVEDLARRRDKPTDMPHTLFNLFTDLIEAEVSEELAQELIQRVQSDISGEDLADPMLVKARIARMIEDEIRTTGPIRVARGGRRVIALVGPTGVGKTTTIAKLAANYRLREKRRVGLVTVDTYRIAAVEQMRTYADIMDLPMEVVSTPREMREAVNRLSNLDVVFMDTAGRSPRDELKIQELKSMLAEAAADEVHLVLSSVSSAGSLISTAKQFAQVGTTALV
ncbi:MAG: flagellar biosynthesis protein FlhF, partial [Pirellulales bacterium]